MRQENPIRDAWRLRLAAEAERNQVAAASTYSICIRRRSLLTIVGALLFYIWSVADSGAFPRSNIHQIGHQIFTVISLGNIQLLTPQMADSVGHVYAVGWANWWQYWIACAGGALGELIIATVLASLAPALLRGIGIAMFAAVIFGLILPRGPYAGELFHPNQEPALAIVLIAAAMLLPVLIRLIWRDSHRQSLWKEIVPDGRDVRETVAMVRRDLAARGFYDKPVRHQIHRSSRRRSR